MIIISGYQSEVGDSNSYSIIKEEGVVLSDGKIKIIIEYDINKKDHGVRLLGIF